MRLIIHRLTVSIVMLVVYGYQMASENDTIVKSMEKAMNMISEATFPGAIAVNTFPIRACFSERAVPF
jgi:hypothetical protein